MDEKIKQAYMALYQWATRLNEWEYDKQYKREKVKSKSKKIHQFIPNAYSLTLIEANKDMMRGKIEPGEAMALLWTIEGLTERNNCMNAGF